MEKREYSQPFYETFVIGPSRDGVTLNQHQWALWFACNLPEFTETFSTAGRLLEAFGYGVRLTYRHHNVRQLYPEVVFTQDVPVVNTPIWFDSENWLFIFKWPYILTASKLDINLRTTITRKTGELFFDGLMTDLMKLAGCEEADHSIYSSEASNKTRYIDPLSITLGQADADDSEFHALQWQLKVAQMEKMPQHTVSVIKERLKNAEVFRSKSRGTRNSR